MPSLGAPALLTGYTCGPFSCTGDTPEAQTALFQLQRLANAAAAVLGIPDRVTPDGKIGSKTVDLIQFIAVRLADVQTSTIREFWAATKAEIAEHAPALIVELTGITESGSPLTPNLPVVGTVGPRISIPIRTVPAVSTTSAAGQVFVPVVKTPYLVAGVASAVVLLLGGIAFAVSKHSSSSMAGARTDRRRVSHSHFPHVRDLHAHAVKRGASPTPIRYNERKKEFGFSYLAHPPIVHAPPYGAH